MFNKDIILYSFVKLSDTNSFAPLEIIYSSNVTSILDCEPFCTSDLSCVMFVQFKNECWGFTNVRDRFFFTGNDINAYFKFVNGVRQYNYTVRGVDVPL